jgi:hypothetical protein
MCNAPDNKDFIGYSDVFNGLISQDPECVRRGFDSIVRGHAKQCKRGGVFHGLEDEVLCVRGVGLAHLASQYGFTVFAIPPLIPELALQA